MNAALRFTLDLTPALAAAGPASGLFGRGLFMVLLDALAFLAVLFVILCLWDLRPGRHAPKALVEELCLLIHEDLVDQAIHLCGARDSFLASACEGALSRWNEGYAAMREVVELKLRWRAAAARRRLKWLSAVSVLGPLVGFLGTLAGWSALLRAPGLTGAVGSLGEPLALALTTSAVGLILAALARVAVIVLEARLDRVTEDAERAALLVLEPRRRSETEPS